MVLYLNGNSLNLKQIYTDGSKQQTGMGAAIYSSVLNINQQYKLPTVAETFAIRQTLLYIQQNYISDVLILTDSQRNIFLTWIHGHKKRKGKERKGKS